MARWRTPTCVPITSELAAGRNGLSSPATIERIIDLGWGSRVYLRLEDDQVVVAQVGNEDVNGLGSQREVHVDLARAQVFSPDGAASLGSDELAPL